MKTKTIHQMIKADEILSSGKSHPLELNSAAESKLVMSHFLRSFRGCSDFLTVFPQAPRDEFALSLECLRNSLFSGDLSQSEILLTQIRPESEVEKAELAVELCRFHIFKGRIDDAIAVSEQALQSPELSDLSRMTCFQMRGHCRILQANFSEAILELKRAVLLADTFDHASSAFSARAFLAQAYAEIGDRSEAQKIIDSLKTHLETLSSDELWLDRLLIVIRAEIQSHRVFEERAQWYSKALEAREISLWLGDKITLNKCENELKQLAEKSSGELSASPVLHFSGWEYFPSKDLILIHFPRKISRIAKNPVARRILQLLAQGPISSEDFFERIWKVKYHPERHGTHVRATLSKVRKLLPAGALVVESGFVIIK